MRLGLNIGYSRTCRILAELEEQGVVRKLKTPGLWSVNREQARKYLLVNTAN